MNAYAQKIADAERDLGPLSDTQKADLLLDNFLELRGFNDALAIVRGLRNFEFIGKDGSSHFRVTGDNCVCGWTIVNDFEWDLHLRQVGAVTSVDGDAGAVYVPIWDREDPWHCWIRAAVHCFDGKEFSFFVRMESARFCLRVAAVAAKLPRPPRRLPPQFSWKGIPGKS